MSNPGLRQPMGPLSVGNVVSAALVLYRSHLKSYLGIALLATLWVMLPLLLIIPIAVLFATRVLELTALWFVVPIVLVLLVFCSAKYAINSALISRLSFSEMVSKPESISTARTQLKPRFWSFLILGLLTGFLLFFAYIALSIVTGIMVAILYILLASQSQVWVTIVTIILSIVIVLGGLIWFYSRLLIAEVVLAVEEEAKPVKSISRSWELSQNSVFRIQGVLIVAILVTLPILALTSYLPQLLLLRVEPGSPTYWTLYAVLFVISILSGALILPVWQAIKAVLYYDLRSRREGLDLQMRDS